MRLPRGFNEKIKEHAIVKSFHPVSTIILFAEGKILDFQLMKIIYMENRWGEARI